MWNQKNIIIYLYFPLRTIQSPFLSWWSSINKFWILCIWDKLSLLPCILGDRNFPGLMLSHMLQPHEHFLLRPVKLPSLFLGRAESQREVMSAFHGKEQYMKTFQINLTFTRNAVGCINFRYAGKQEIIFHVDDVSIPSPLSGPLRWEGGREVLSFNEI